MIKKLLVAVSLAAASVAAAPAAQAAQFLTFDGTSGTFGFNSVAGGSFSHTFNFTVGTGTAGSTISSIKVSNTNDIDFDSVTLNGVEFDVDVDTDNVEFRSISQLVSAGEQTIIVAGTSGGNGSYSGDLAFAPVPEPATWAMMIGGFGLVGGAMRRRRVQGKIVTA